MHDNGEEKTDILVLVDEEGNEHDFAMVDRFAVEMKEYAILVPVIYQGEETLVEVEDEDEWSSVAALWEERADELDLEEDEDN